MRYMTNKIFMNMCKWDMYTHNKTSVSVQLCQHKKYEIQLVAYNKVHFTSNFHNHYWEKCRIFCQQFYQIKLYNGLYGANTCNTNFCQPNSTLNDRKAPIAYLKMSSSFLICASNMESWRLRRDLEGWLTHPKWRYKL